ncbi:MAG: sigma-54 dependent transcriptional regulator [Desulfurivibrio sp.]|nr:sigma-54 dependent transcriptional regulator [Desulfurivibrio sp.]
MAKILTIDDDPMICEVFHDFVQSLGHEHVAAQRMDDGLASMERERPDLVFLDVNLPDGDGLAAIPTIRDQEFSPEVIIITGEGTSDGADLAIRNGAWDYVRKPLSVEGMQLSLNRALEYRSRKAATADAATLHRGEIIGESPAVRSCLKTVAKAAAGDMPVLITGETGTGKELFARAIHDNSPRAHKNFVVVDCASLPPSLVESTLFGHEKGAFTGADQSHTGLVGQAHQGTLFLDEVGELPLAVQKTFLRVLQEQRYRAVGGSRELASSFRLVAATNRDLEAMAAQGEFRQDLLFRLRGLDCQLPPLRQRGEDIVELSMTHCARLSEFNRLPAKGFCPDFLHILQQYDWPGNVRELLNVITHAFTQAGSEPVLYPIHLPSDIRAKVKVREMECQDNKHQAATVDPPSASATATHPPENPAAELLPPGPLPSLQDARNRIISRLEREYLQQLLQKSAQDMNSACTISGLSLSQLYRLLRKHQIKS